MICWFKQEKCSHLMPASLVYSKSVIVFIALFVEYPEECRLCFLLCHNLRLHKLKNCGIALF